jgi:hypothetical protein
MFRPPLVIVGFALTVPCALALPDAQPAASSADGRAVQLEPVPTGHLQIAHRQIFVCRDRTIAVYADRPCGELAMRRELVLRIPDVSAGRAPTTEPALPAAATKPRPEPEGAPRDPKAEARARCKQLDKALETVNEHMRTGYSAREAPRLWQRWRDAQERLHDAGC